MRHAFSFFALLAAVSAAHADPVNVSRDDRAPPDFRAAVVVVSDAQVHNPFGDFVPVMQTVPSDWLTRVAVRPPELDLLSLDLLERLLGDSATRYGQTPLLHLGDASDVSCTDEFARFLDTMTRSGRPWAYAPGNHDGFFFGNAHLREGAADALANLGLGLDAWNKGCKNAGRPMDKAEVVRMYVANLRRVAARPDFTCRTIAAALPQAPGADGNLACAAGEATPFLAAVAWHIDAREPWHSWVVQKVQLGSPDARWTGILWDTASYVRPPAFATVGPAYAAGLVGEVPPDELAVLGRLLAGTGGRAIVFGHHHYASLTEEARKALFGWIRAGDVMMYMSGHTHNGHWISHYGVEAGDKEAARATESVRWTELNLGSTVDWPIEYRALAVSAPAANRTTTINAPIYRLDETAACAGDVIEKDFEAYKKALVPGGATYSEYANRALFDVFRRLLGIAPTAVTPTNVGAIQWPCADCRADSAVLEAIRKMSASNDLDAQARMLVALARFDAERPLAAAPRADRDRLRRCYAFIASRQETNQGDPFSAPSDECTLDSQCGASRYCNTGVEGIGRNVCRPRIADGGACTKEHQCTSGRCSPWRPQDGQATGICYTPASRAGGQSCRIDLECRAGKCNSNKVCVCKDDGDCAGGFYCDQGLDLHQNACKRKLADGESCGVGIDIGRRCQSGKCILGKCK